MEDNKAMVIFQPSGRRGEVPKDITLIEASRLLGVDIESCLLYTSPSPRDRS